MSEFVKWLTDNPAAGTSLAIGTGFLAIAAALIYIVAFFQGRDISFWPPKIGPRPPADTNSAGQKQGGLPTLDRGFSPENSAIQVESVQVNGIVDPPKGKYSIAGYWEMRDWLYDYDNAESREDLEERSKKSTFSDNARLEQDAQNRVTGEFENSVSRYRVAGIVEGFIFTGNWQEVDRTRKVTWHGTFQFRITPHRDGATMSGRWTGTSADEERIHCGEWEWRERLEPTKQSKRKWPSEERMENSLDTLLKSEAVKEPTAGDTPTLPLYAKDDSNAPSVVHLDPITRQVLTIVSEFTHLEDGGIFISDLRSQTDLPADELVFHLEKLLKFKLIAGNSITIQELPDGGQRWRSERKFWATTEGREYLFQAKGQNKIEGGEST